MGKAQELGKTTLDKTVEGSGLLRQEIRFNLSSVEIAHSHRNAESDNA